MEKICVDKTASRGIAVAPVYLYLDPDLSADCSQISEGQVQEELDKFAEAKAAVISDLTALSQKNEIFAAHLEIADDFMLQDGVENKVKNELKNVQQAVSETIEEFAVIFESMDDEYMKERAADVKDIGKRLMARIKHVKLPDLGGIAEPVVVVARDMFPSDTVKIDSSLVKGIITEEGGVTSHVSIIAKSMGIPTLVGVKGILSKVADGEVICMNAKEGVIIVQPDEAAVKEYQRQKEFYESEKARLEGLRNTPAVTKEGKRIYLCANVGNLQDIRNALPVNIDGVGLFRSEFLYMQNTHFPTEEEQFKVYKEAAELSSKELTIRTLDIGGDKELSYYEFEKEENPFLGWRAIRISLDMKDMFKDQIRAILRASAFGHVIISIEELREAKAVVEECKKELEEKGQAFDREIEMGMMIETPASVLLADAFAKEADFFSIGTNDLTQYILAVDRGNKKIAKRYDYFHPAVLKAIAQVIEAGHKEGIKVGMCGEMAGDQKAVDFLLDMGLDEFSMSAGSIDYVREQILSRK
jgi:phosphoenolpyruvate-protein phosphotransferase